MNWRVVDNVVESNVGSDVVARTRIISVNYSNGTYHVRWGFLLIVHLCDMAPCREKIADIWKHCIKVEFCWFFYLVC